jgi:hypothetical protein
LYGYKTWSLILKEEHRLRVFENRVLRKIFGHKKEITGGCIRMHSEKLHNLYDSPNIIRVIMSRRVTWTGHVASMREMRKCTQNFGWGS